MILAGSHDGLWDGRRRREGSDGDPGETRWATVPAAMVIRRRGILFGLQLQGQTDIYAVRPDGSGLTQVTDTPTSGGRTGAWRTGAPRAVRARIDGRGAARSSARSSAPLPADPRQPFPLPLPRAALFRRRCAAERRT